MLDRRTFIAGMGATLAVSAALRAGTVHLDVAYVNGQVWVSAGVPLASAIGTVNNHIAAVGGSAVKAMIGPKTQVIDLEGAFVTPGIIEPHVHLFMAAEALVSINLRSAGTPADFAAILGDYAAKVQPGKWIEGGSWDEQLWGGQLPTRHWIDDVTPNNPVAVARLDLHMLLLNSLALKLAGIDRNTPDPEGGIIVRDEQGEPTGILKDKAKDLVQRVIPSMTEAEKEARLRVCTQHALSLGVTQIHTKALDWVSHDALRSLRAKGETDVRFKSFVPLADWQRLQSLIAEEGRGDDWVRWGGLKGLADGSLGSGTALFYDEYTDEPGNKGISFVPLADLREQIIAADGAGLHLAVHAIGDRANDEVLGMFAEAIQKNGPRDRRFIIEHAQHIRPQSFSRFADLGVIASMQPYHAIDDGRWAEKRIGEKRLHGTYAFNSLLKAGVQVGFGSDWPVAPLDPRLGIQAAVLRQTLDGANPEGWLPYEKVSAETALKAYTETNAYVGYQENKLGRLIPGYLADFVIWGGNLLTHAPEKLHEVPVLKTVVDGKVRFVG
ncbi:amidohydrolase [Kordiimonas pumila]|uniref:Amidohydrolase n=1 Tax=Kordiimonas pumila TaxID=2161677 RepID=A0ABV7D5E7_9PROT|nr:amidohydrolase [Kordiimonas pumila]